MSQSSSESGGASAPSAPSGPSPEQRVTMFHNTSLPLATALELPTAAFTYDLLYRHGCTYRRLAAAGVRFSSLQKAGFTTPQHWRDVGMDAIDLRDLVVAQQMVGLYGAAAMKEVFLRTAEDAVAIAGTETADLLTVSLADLLERCAGEPVAAYTVLSRTPRVATTFDRACLPLLLDTGLQAQGLAAAGLPLAMLLPLDPTADELAQLGFHVRL